MDTSFFFNKFSKIFFQISKRCFLTIQTFLFCASFNTIILELFEHTLLFGQSSNRRREGSLCLQENKVRCHHDNLLLEPKSSPYGALNSNLVCKGLTNHWHSLEFQWNVCKLLLVINYNLTYNIIFNRFMVVIIS